MDTRGLHLSKYDVTRRDGRQLGRTFVIEIDKDPDAFKLITAIADAYSGTPGRRSLVDDLRDLARELWLRDNPAHPEDVRDADDLRRRQARPDFRAFSHTLLVDELFAFSSQGSSRFCLSGRFLHDPEVEPPMIEFGLPAEAKAKAEIVIRRIE